MEHVVRAGETLSGIAVSHGVEIELLLASNPSIRDPDVVSAGDRLRLPRQARLLESTSFRGRSAANAPASTWHLVLRTPPTSPSPWQPLTFPALAERRELAPRKAKRRTFRPSRIRKHWIAERQEAAQTAVDDVAPEKGLVWLALEPIRWLTRAAAYGYGLAAHVTDDKDYAFVREGQTLWEHADEAGLSVRSLQRGNRLRSDVIRTGSKLRYAESQAAGPATLLHAARRAWSRLMFPVQLGSPLGDPECYMSSSFGPRFGTFHQGIDLSSEIGEPVLAAADGVVTFTGAQPAPLGTITFSALTVPSVDGTRGLRVDLAHAGAVTTSYVHCSSLLRVPGEQIRRGEPVAVLGETGAIDGPHLHFEVRRFGQPIDPFWVTDGIP